MFDRMFNRKINQKDQTVEWKFKKMMRKKNINSKCLTKISNINLSFMVFKLRKQKKLGLRRSYWRNPI